MYGHDSSWQYDIKQKVVYYTKWKTTSERSLSGSLTLTPPAPDEKPMLLLPEENNSELLDKGAQEDDMTKVKSTKYGLCSWN